MNLRTLRLALVAALPALALVLPAAPASAAATGVAISANTFTPAKVTIGLGHAVRWTNQDQNQHTTTSNQDFWDSGSLNQSQSFKFTFGSAGSYHYHCSIHPDMKGLVRVRMAAQGSPSTGWTVRWATAAAAIGRDFDVQVRRKGTSTWKAFRTNTLKPSGHFDPRRNGTYVFRARTSNTSVDKSSDWSPRKALKIS